MAARDHHVALQDLVGVHRHALAVQALEAPDLPAGVWVRCSVTDTGPGMDETEQSHVFDAFYQAERLGGRPHGGAGLGLTITRELVELMGGHISLRSAPGQGTRVDIDLPMPVAAAPAMPSRAVPEKVSALPPLQILVVDDDEVNRWCATTEPQQRPAAAPAPARSARRYKRMTDRSCRGACGLRTLAVLRGGRPPAATGIPYPGDPR